MYNYKKFRRSFEVSRDFWILIAALTIFLLTRFELIDIFLARYPFQDLYWNDLQLNNSYRWFVDSFKADFFGFWFRNTDFLLGAGQEVFTTKSPNIFIDISSWLALFFSRSESLVIRYILFSIIFGYGIYKISTLRKNTSITETIIVLVSGLSSPIFYFEIGLLNQYYLFLVPLFIWSLIKVCEVKNLKDVDFKYFYVFLTMLILMLGVSDLFIFSNISAIFFFVWMVHLKAWKNLLKIYAFAVGICLINFLPVFHSEAYSLLGTWNFHNMWDIFGRKVFSSHTSIILRGNFLGPITLYITIFTFSFYILKLISLRKNANQLRVLLAPIITLLILYFAGLIMHAIPLISSKLPSLIRYHLSIFPFLLAIAILLVDSNYKKKSLIIHSALIILIFYITIFSLGSLIYFILIMMLIIFTINRSKNDWVHLFLSLALIFFVTHFLKYYDNFSSSPLNKDWFIDKNVRSYSTNNLQSCIREILNTGNIIETEQTESGFIFTSFAKEGETRARNDLLMFLAEQPDKLHSRTFNIWRYSLGYFDINASSRFGFDGLFNFAFPVSKIDSVLAFSDYVQSSVLISSIPILNKRLAEVGVCNGVARNEAPYLVDEMFLKTYVYRIIPITEVKYNFHFNSSDIWINNIPSDYEKIQLPINFHSSIRVYDEENRPLVVKKTPSSSIDVQIKNTGRINKIRVTSFDFFTGLSRIILVLTLIFSFASLLNILRLRIKYWHEGKVVN
jgi:hypothetical protein